MTRAKLFSDPSFLPILDRFFIALPKRTLAMREALESGRLDVVAYFAHQMRGAGGGYGYPSISNAAEDIEVFCHAAEALAIAESIARLERACAEAHEEWLTQGLKQGE